MSEFRNIPPSSTATFRSPSATTVEEYEILLRIPKLPDEPFMEFDKATSYIAGEGPELCDLTLDERLFGSSSLNDFPFHMLLIARALAGEDDKFDITWFHHFEDEVRGLFAWRKRTNIDAEKVSEITMILRERAQQQEERQTFTRLRDMIWSSVSSHQVRLFGRRAVAPPHPPSDEVILQEGDPTFSGEAEQVPVGFFADRYYYSSRCLHPEGSGRSLDTRAMWGDLRLTREDVVFLKEFHGGAFGKSRALPIPKVTHRMPPAKQRKWFQETFLMGDRSRPTVREQWEAAQLAGIRRHELRKLREQFAPEEWKKPGRRS